MAAQEVTDKDRVGQELNELVAASHAAGTEGWTTAGDLKEKFVLIDEALVGRLWPHGLCNTNVLDIAEGLGYTVVRGDVGWKRPARFPKTAKGKFKSGIRPSADQAASNAIAGAAAAAASAPGDPVSMDVDSATAAQDPAASASPNSGAASSGAASSGAASGAAPSGTQGGELPTGASSSSSGASQGTGGPTHTATREGEPSMLLGAPPAKKRRVADAEDEDDDRTPMTSQGSSSGIIVSDGEAPDAAAEATVLRDDFRVRAAEHSLEVGAAAAQPMTAQEVREAAAAEGLELVPADNQTGFKCVATNGSVGCMNPARISVTL